MSIKLWQSGSIADMADRAFTDWLYGTYDEDKYNEVTFLYNSHPVMRSIIDYKLDQRAAKEYLARNHMDYSDIHDPRKLIGFNSQGNLYGYGLNWASSNISKLYHR